MCASKCNIIRTPSKKFLYILFSTYRVMCKRRHSKQEACSVLAGGPKCSLTLYLSFKHTHTQYLSLIYTHAENAISFSVTVMLTNSIGSDVCVRVCVCVCVRERKRERCLRQPLLVGLPLSSFSDSLFPKI